jgi:hypothetical protein
MSDHVFAKNRLSLSSDPVFVVCDRCSMAFTHLAIYNHMSTHDDFKEAEDFFLLAMERHKVARNFAAPLYPIEPLPRVSVFIGMMCGSPGCTRYFHDADMLSRHARTAHPKESLLEGIPCTLQEVQDVGDHVLRFHVFDHTKVEGS